MRNGYKFYQAMDEYFAEQAENMAWDSKSASMWDKIVYQEIFQKKIGTFLVHYLMSKTDYLCLCDVYVGENFKSPNILILSVLYP